ncbi:hypothetical protein TTHERM_00716130 (macronuclear) [Tetrahymena thermophila SB210]|uniref:Uncharacterized protein n=1 Tax=Tetrahymena thermophila (strain SB210) TaxID=312017 RepID=I7MCM6_TETTS|nr:hypothetical protein TTHERM_00716130 [Tetrahymena thermophila SB210]EAR84307.1 hypothetical protein TTHERM_00716130 [Tetrahymena thermophila SB210]|eukprot:XP_001031970.1 hypothetical protein TTHERM_00716130 [Tetrahymena thermophila SB210]
MYSIKNSLDICLDKLQFFRFRSLIKTLTLIKICFGIDQSSNQLEWLLRYFLIEFENSLIKIKKDSQINNYKQSTQAEAKKQADNKQALQILYLVLF